MSKGLVEDDPLQGLVRQFNEAINSQDMKGLAELMSSEHAFMDTAGHAIRGKQETLKAWESFFAAFPDYQNVFEGLVTKEDLVVIVGRSSCSDRRLDGPALWTARVENGKITEWRVFDDTPDNRRQLGVEQGT